MVNKMIPITLFQRVICGIYQLFFFGVNFEQEDADGGDNLV